MENNITDMMEAASNELPTDDAIVEVSKLAATQIELEDKVAFLENQLAETVAMLNELSGVILPNKLAELGITRIDLSDGSRVEIKNDIAASITKECEAEAFSWLKDHGHDDLIKNEVKLSFGRGEEQQAEGIVSRLREEGVRSLAIKKSVHPQTLKAFVKECLERGENIPMDTFGIYPYAKTRIKRS